MNINFNMPLNAVSFGVTSIAILREAFRRGIPASLCPISQIDMAAQPNDAAFSSWLGEAQMRFLSSHSKETPSVKLWHINGLLEGCSNEQAAITFLETDSITPAERHILSRQKAVFVTSNFTKRVMEDFGLRNVRYLELGFDSDNFFPTGKPYMGRDVVVFTLFGKLENRKAHLKTIKAWARKYGNDRRYRLHAAIFNPFMKTEDQLAAIGQALEGKTYWNIQFMGWVRTNAEFNETVNSGNIVLGLSGGEGFDIPVFSSIAMGKHAVVLDAHAYRDYANKENAVLLPPSGKRPSHDGVFFHHGQPFNQGYFFDWNEEEMIGAMEEAVKRHEIDPINKPGLGLRDRTFAKTLDAILEVVG